MTPFNKDKKRVSFSRSPFENSSPDLLGLQLASFKQLFQPDDSPKEKKTRKLYQIFQEYFPVLDNKGNYRLEFLDYTIDPPYYTPEECLEKGSTYEAPLKGLFRLSCKDQGKDEIIEQKVYLGDIPFMTPKGTFIYKGNERVVISQIKRVHGIFFSEHKHANGVNLYTAKIIPEQGTWIELSIDMYGAMYAYLDRRKKIPVTTLLRTIGYGSDKDILQLFNLAEEVEVDKKELYQYKGCPLAGPILENWDEEFVDEDTGEVMVVNRHKVIIERNTLLDDEVIEKIINTGEKTIMLLKKEASNSDHYFIYNTLQKDNTNSEKEAIEYLYSLVRNVEPPDEQTAKEFVKQLLFSPKRSYLGETGRYSLNKKLKLNIPENNHLLTEKDITATVKAFGDLISGKRIPEDVDSLANRIVLLAGDLLEQILNNGIKLTANNIKENINARNSEDLTPFQVVSGHYLASVINKFFGLNSSSQYMDQTNPLSGLSHITRATKTGKGLTLERAGFAVRDIHPTQYGRICPITTPEGPSIGLTVHLARYAKVDKRGFLKTPYKKVINGIVDMKKDCYLTAEEEEGKVIAEYTTAINKEGRLTSEKLYVRDQRGEPAYVAPEKIDYINSRNDLCFSAATSLIPFIGNTDATRALMGSNMCRQAVPLLKPEPPIVGTGREKSIAKDARVLLTAKEDGTVEYVDAQKIIIRHQVPEKFKNVSFVPTTKTYHLARLRPTNQGTDITEKPIVRKGDKVKKGQFLSEGYGIKDKELAIGCNLKVAFMSYDGFSFEDSIVISERLLKEDILTSIHIQDFVVDLYSTKLGPEEFTADIPNISEEAIKHLDERGIISVGKEIKEGDILVGKITPQSNENPSSEAKLMAAIFGNLASSVKNTSFKAPFGCEGTVISTKILHGPEIYEDKRKEIKEKVVSLKTKTGEELTALRKKAIEKLTALLKGKKLKSIQKFDGTQLIENDETLSETIIAKTLFPQIALTKTTRDNLELQVISYRWTEMPLVNEQIQYIFTSYKKCARQIFNEYTKEKRKIEVGDELRPGILKQAVVRIAKKCKIEVGDKISGRHGNKGVIAKIAAEEDMPFHADGTRVDLILNPLSLPSRMNIGQVQETILGWPGEKLGKRFTVPIFEEISLDEINEQLKKADLPEYGRTTLYDGFTGEPFEQKITCGCIYILKLNHLVHKKIYARAAGPSYALITQQPLGGRVRKGGQKFGNMEVWAMQAYGAANILQELLTVKSDDIYGRQKVQEAIYKGYNHPTPSVPESLKILEQYLAALCIDLNFIKTNS